MTTTGAGTNMTELDRERYRDFSVQIPTGVTVVATRTAAGPVGLVVGTFSQVSFDPPLVSFMVKTGSRSWSAVQSGRRFTANILASDQRQLSQVLAGWSPDKFRDVSFDDEQTEALVIRGCIAWADCRIEREVEAGDHTIVLATPSQLRVVRHSARPLVYFQRAYHRTLRVEESRAPGWA
jgi:3-hydroxy-9,10-secoandrosta-1,3,5(10)-triene-9,17-dione monooxygenase reductase component